MINNISNKKVQKVDSIQSSVYAVTKGHSFCHHASIIFYKDYFYALWSNGLKNEDDCGQRILLAKSKDCLKWSEPLTVAGPFSDGKKHGVYTAGGLYVYGETLNVYYGSYEYKTENISINEYGIPERLNLGDTGHSDTSLFCRTTTDGNVFSEAIDMKIGITPNHAPRQLENGRLIMSGNFMFPYSDNPDGIHDYKISGVYGDSFEGRKPIDDSESIHYVTKHMGWPLNLLCEGSFYVLDEKIRMLFRSNTDVLFYSDSFDNGENWSEPLPTQFGATSKFCCGNLKDGRIFCVYNPENTNRIPLMIALSEDGENFRSKYIIRDEGRDMVYPGLYKGGIYGYPDVIEHDGNIYVIYSVNKEAVEISVVPLSELN